MKKNIIKAVFLTLVLSAVFGSAVSKDTTINYNLENNYLPSSHITRVTIGGIVIIPGPGCYRACVPVYNNCMADESFPSWECEERRRDCQSICLGGWIL